MKRFITLLAAFCGLTSFVASPVFAATIVSTEAELSEALAAGGEITLGADITLSETVEIPSDKTITLDLNGKTINAAWADESAAKHIYALTNNGTLTITDSSADKNGSINARGMYNDGKLTLEAGTINAIDGNGGYGVCNKPGSTFVMNGGTVAAIYEDDNLSDKGGFDATPVYLEADATSTMNGGTINNVSDFTFAIMTAGTLDIPATSTITVEGRHGAINVSGGTTTVNAGTFSIPENTEFSDNVTYVSGGELIINGGTFIADNDRDSGGCCVYDPSGGATINGGTFGNSSGGDVWGKDGGTVIKGGTFENLIETQHVTVGSTITNGGKIYTKTESGLTEVFPAYVVLPEDFTVENYETLFGENTVTDGTNYYATLQAAVEAVCGNSGATLYCKPGADVGSLQHAPVTATLTVYGNGASVTGDTERDFDIGNTDPSGGADITADMTLTVKNLNGCGAWGAKATSHTVNLVFEGCTNMGKVFITGTVGTLNITMTDCAFEGVIKEALYSNADGAITLTNVDFSNLNKAVNLNHKATGTQTITMTGCSFTNCGADVAADQIPVRVLSSEGGKSVLTVDACTFSGTPEGGADILIDYGVGETTATVTTSTTAANVVVEKTNNVGETTTVPAGTTTAQQFTTAKPVAKIGDAEYATLAAAAKAAQAGDVIVLQADITETDTITIPADVTLNGNGKTIVGGIKAGGNLTLAGATTVNTFSAGWYNNVITIGEGASLKVTGGRITVSYGNTFNIVGSIADAKTADKSTLTPSLELTSGISFNGDGGGVNFNVKNAYVKIGDSTTKNSGATGTFNLNFENSVVDFPKTLKTYAPTATGLAPVFNLTAKDSVVTFASHLEFWLANTTMSLDKTDMTVGGSFANAGTVNLSNGANFVVNAPIMSSHGGNTGTITVSGGTFELKDSNQDWENEGTIEVASPGKLIFNDFQCVDGGVVAVDATGLAVGDSITGLVSLNSKNTEFIYSDITVAGNDSLAVDAEGIIVEKPVAQVGETVYSTIEDAFKAATSGCTITLLSNVTVTDKWDCRYTGSKFTVPVTINGNGKKLTFTGSVVDNNWNTVFRFEETATVKNLTIDASAATDIQRGISTKGSVTVENCTLIGNGTTARRGVIFGEGAGAAIADVVATIDNCVFTGWTWGVTDNQNAQDAKAVSITDSTFNGSGALLSASTSVTFTGNTMTDAYVNITSYTTPNALTVTATGNTLAANTDTKYNSVNGATVDAQEGFLQFVAQIGDVKYTSLQAAIEAIETEGTITLINNAIQAKDTQVVIPAGKTITLDLNGKTYTGGNYNLPSNDAGYIIKNQGTLTITGDANSVMSANGLESGYGIIVNNGTLTLNGGTYTGSVWNGVSGDHPGYTIRNCGEMTINEGVTIHGTFGCLSNPGGNLTVNGGTFTNSDLPGTTHYLICAWGGGLVTLNNGEFTFYSTDANAMGSPIFGAWDGGSFVINGGTFDANQGAMGYGSAAVTIKGGIFKNAAKNVFQNAAGIAVLCAPGYVVTENADGTYGVAVDPKAEGMAASVTTAEGVTPAVTTYYETFAEALAAATAGQTLTLFADIETSDIITIDKAITLDGNGKTLTSTAGRAINVSGANGVTIKNLTINCTGERGINIIQNATNVTIDNVTATANNYTVCVAGSAPNAVVTVKNSDLTGLNVVNVGAAGANVTVTDTKITCDDQNENEIYAALCLNMDAVGATITANGCTFDVKGDSQKARNSTDDGIITIGGSADGVVTMVAAIKYGNYHASFATLADAIEAAQEGDTITLLADIESSEIIVIDKAITIDGNDKTLTYTGEGADARAINVKVDGAVTINDLTINAANAERAINVITHPATLTLNNVTATADNYAVNVAGSADNAVVTITNSDLTGLNVVNVAGAGANVTVKNTKLTNNNTDEDQAFTVLNLNKDATGGTITATGCTFMLGINTVKGRNDAEKGTITIDGTTDGVDVSVAYIDYGNYYAPYTTLAKAVAAATAGQTIKLIRDIATSETFTIADGVAITLDMNGKKITATDDKTSNYELFYIYGELTVTGDGTIELTATTNREWNASSSIFHNRGGVLTIENGTFTHKGGTDMAFVIDNSANWYGDATTTINGGTIHSSYTAIRNRMEQNSHGASGKAYLTITAGSVDGGTSAIWAQAASTSETSPATGEITISGGTIGVVNTARSEGAECMTTISGGTVAKFKGEVGELTVTGGTLQAVEILTAGGTAADYAITDDGLYAPAVAKIGDVMYASLPAAIAAAEEGETITLIADIELTSSVEISGKTMTLDLGKYKILDKSTTVLTSDSNVWGLIELTDEAKLTVTGTGTIECEYTVVSGGWTGMAYCINVDATSELVVEGGTFINGNGGIQTRGKVTVNDGTFVSHNGGTCIMAVYSDANVSVNGGDFSDSVEESDVYTGSGAVWGGFGATIAITGGTFDFAADPSHNNIVWTLFPAQNAIAGSDEENADMTVSGGTFVNFNPETDVVIDYSASTGFTLGSVVADGYAALSDLDGNYVVGAKPTATVNNLGSMTIPESDYMVYGGSVDGDMPLSFVMQFLADQDADDMVTSPYADWYADFVLTFTGLENGSFTANGCYLAGYYGDFGWVKVPVDGMTIENGARYPVMLGVGMGQKYDYICESVKDFRCALYLTDEILEANPNLKVKLELSIVDNSKGEDEAREALADNEYVNVVGETSYDAEDFASDVAQIGDVEYKTLQEAIDAATEGQTVQLIANVALAKMVTVAEGKVLTLDLNGYAITVPEVASGTNHIYALNNKGVMTIKDTSAEGTGSISARGIYNGYNGNDIDAAVAGAKMTIEGGNFFGLDANGGAAIFNCAELIIEDGFFHGEAVAVNSRAAGVATINGGTFEATSANKLYTVQNSGTMTITGGTISKGFGALSNYGGTLTINGGTFNIVDDLLGTTNYLIYMGDGEAIINDGSFYFECDDADAMGCPIFGFSEGSLTINGGTFDATQGAMGYGTAPITLKGGTFKNAAKDVFQNEDDIKVYLAEGYAALKDLNGNYVVGKEPTATVNDLDAMVIPESDYKVYNGSKSGDMPLNFVMQFLANQNAEDMKTSPYADWYADFVLTFEGLENGSFTAEGCYLAGYYGDFGWVKVPVDGMTIENGARYPVMLGVGMGQKYDYICSGVKDFRCAMYLTPEVLAANPKLKVKLELSIVDDSKGEDEALNALAATSLKYVNVIGETEYTMNDFASLAQVGDTKYPTLTMAIAAAGEDGFVTILKPEAIPAEEEDLVIAKTGGTDAEPIEGKDAAEIAKVLGGAFKVDEGTLVYDYDLGVQAVTFTADKFVMTIGLTEGEDNAKVTREFTDRWVVVSVDGTKVDDLCPLTEIVNGIATVELDKGTILDSTAPESGSTTKRISFAIVDEEPPF